MRYCIESLQIKKYKIALNCCVFAVIKFQEFVTWQFVLVYADYRISLANMHFCKIPKIIILSQLTGVDKEEEL